MAQGLLLPPTRRVAPVFNSPATQSFAMVSKGRKDGRVDHVLGRSVGVPPEPEPEPEAIRKQHTKQTKVRSKPIPQTNK